MKRETLFLLLLIITCGFFIRIHDIGTMNFWYDEIALWIYSFSGNPYEVFTPHEAPLMAWILYCLMWFFQSDNALFIHIISVLAGTATIPVCYLLVLHISDSRLAAILASVLIMGSPMSIYYSREGRPYALFMLLSSALLLSFLVAHRKNTASTWSLYSLLLFLTCLSHMLVIHVVFCITAYMLALLFFPGEHPRRYWFSRFRCFVLSSVVGGIPGSTWMIIRYFETQNSGMPLNFVFMGPYPFGLDNFIRTIAVNFGPGPVWSYSGEKPFESFELLAVALHICFFSGLFVLFKSGKSDYSLLFLLLYSVPIAIMYITLGPFSATFPWARYISHSLTPFLVIAGCGLGSLAFPGKFSLARSAIPIVLLLFLVPRAFQYHERYDDKLHQDQSRYLKTEVDHLTGVLIVPYQHDIGPVDLRISHIHHYFKNEHLPVFHVSNFQLKGITMVDSPGNITTLPQEIDSPLTDFKSGRYALLGRNTVIDCRKVMQSIRNINLGADTCSVVMKGLTVCDISVNQ